MAASLLASPAPARAQAFRSPARAPRADACEGVGGEELYAEAQARLVQWRKDLVGTAGLEAQQALRELCHERECLADLRQDLAGVKGLVQAASRLQVGGARLADVVHRSAGAAGERAQAMACVRDELQALREGHGRELQQEERERAQQRAAADARHDDALGLLGVYQDRLGLALSRVAPQVVRVAFSLLDESDPGREFSFTLGLADRTQAVGYYVGDCLPQVTELPRLLAELNADGSSVAALPRFVCGMRRAFRKLAGPSKAA